MLQRQLFISGPVYSLSGRQVIHYSIIIEPNIWPNELWGLKKDLPTDKFIVIAVLFI